MPDAQPQLGLFEVPEDHGNVRWLLSFLDGKGWMTAAEIVKAAGMAVTDDNKRWVRTLADASRGRVGGGQKGYKLITQMTREEYEHTRNWLSHQADAMKRRVIEMDQVWYARKPVHPGNGVLQPS